MIIYWNCIFRSEILFDRNGGGDGVLTLSTLNPHVIDIVIAKLYHYVPEWQTITMENHLDVECSQDDMNEAFSLRLIT